MKILFVSHYSFLYGSNRSLDSLIDYFRGKGEDVEVLLPSKGKFFEHLKSKGIKVHSLRFFYEVMYVKWNKKYLSLPILWIYNAMVFPLLLWKVKKEMPTGRAMPVRACRCRRMASASRCRCFG